MTTVDRLPVGQWFWANDQVPHAGPDGDEHARHERLRRQHGLQIALDMVAHAQHIPLRLLRLNRLLHLDRTFVAFVARWSVIDRDSAEAMLQGQQSVLMRIMTDEGHIGPDKRPHALSPEQATVLIEHFKDATNVEKVRDWVLRLASSNPWHPADLPAHYLDWFLELLPHLEREVWLTDMSNVLPAHNLARMIQHWALYVLMWGWTYCRTTVAAAGTEDGSMESAFAAPRQALGVQGLHTLLRPLFFRPSLPSAVGTEERIWLVVGPYEHMAQDLTDDHHATTIEDDPHDAVAERFCAHFRRLLANASRVAGWADVERHAPEDAELRDAFATHVSLADPEARRRTEGCINALELLWRAKLDASIGLWPDGSSGRPMSRANWESIAALCTYADRWSWQLFSRLRAARDPLGTEVHEALQWVRIWIPGHRIGLLLEFDVDADDSRPIDIVLVDAKYGETDDTWARACDVHKLIETPLNDLPRGDVPSEARHLLIETPGNFFARARERQHGMWTAHVVAVLNLLTRHSRRDRFIGPDQATTSTENLEGSYEAEHLLRGYGARVCQHLLQLARADVALIRWLDYSQDPPQLRHVGGADRLLQHRGQQRERYRRFLDWVNTPDAQTRQPPCSAGQNSLSELYRCVALADITPERRDANNAESRRARGYFEHYADPRVQDALTVPLLHCGRVVGVFMLGSIASIRHFDRRLHPPLRRVAQLLAQEMASQSQIWHMRRLNWLASHRRLDEWKQYSAENAFNPLEPVARLLANIFLSPVVHIWLADRQKNEARFKLYGYTHRSLAFPDAGGVNSPPEYEIVAGSSQIDVTRAFIGFACDIWADRGGLPTIERPGAFVQARLERAKNEELQRPTSGYTAADAERGQTVLRDDYLACPDPASMRKPIFEIAGLTETMAFALIDGDAPSPNLVGIVSLHAYGLIGEVGSGKPAWPPSWRALVGHMQTYLPYVLMQTEAIANPIDNARRLLLHEAGNQLSRLYQLAAELTSASATLFDERSPPGIVRPALTDARRVLETHFQRLPDQASREDILAVLRMLDDACVALSRAEPEIRTHVEPESYRFVQRIINNQRNLVFLEQRSNLRAIRSIRIEWVDLNSLLAQAHRAYRADYDNASIWLRGIPIDAKRPQVLTCEPLFFWMLRDLVHNIAKYATSGTDAEVHWIDSSPKIGYSYLVFTNTSSFDPELDLSGKLGKFGYRGSAGSQGGRVIRNSPLGKADGTGIGLWGAKEVGRTLDMDLTITVDGDPNGKLGRYRFAIAIPSNLVRMA